MTTMGSVETQQRKAVASVRERLFNPPNAALPKKFEEAQKHIAFLKFEIEKRDRTIEKAEMDNSDLQATIVSQAKRICELDGITISLNPKRPVKRIVEMVLRNFPDVDWEDVAGRRRSRIIVEARHACFVAVFKERPDLSYPSIAKIFNRDHTSIIHAVQKHGASDYRKEQA